MTKTERTIYALVGPVRYNTLSFSLAIDTAMELLFVRKIAMDDIRVTRDIYAPTAARLGKTTTAVSRQIVRLCNLCWDTMQDTGEVEQYIGKPIRDLRAPNEMIFYLASQAYWEIPYFQAMEEGKIPLFSPQENRKPASSRRKKKD